MLFRYAYAFARDKSLAQDAVQECFFRYFLHRKANNVVENPRAWLFRVLRNYIVDRLRETSSWCEVPISEIPEQAGFPEDSELGHEWAEALKQIPDLLAPREFECLQLRAEGLRYEEIGVILGISAGTVGALLTRALKKLRLALRGTKPEKRSPIG